MKDWRESDGLLNRLTTGRALKDNGVGLVPQPDPVHVVNYMDVPNPGDGNFSGSEQDPSLTQMMGMDSGDGKYGQQPIDMVKANDWSDEPTKGGLSYGPSGMDSERDRNRRGGY